MERVVPVIVGLAVDPGVHQCGYARGDGRRVTQAGMWDTLRGPIWPQILPGMSAADPAHAVSEIPQVYQGTGKGAVRSKDLVDLVVVAGRVCGFHRVTYVRPASWKGQVPKKIHHARMWRILDTEETALLKDLDVAKGLRHNVYDAVCLLLRTYGRM